MVPTYLLVNLIAVVMPGEIHNRVEELPFSFPEKREEETNNNTEKNKDSQDGNKKKVQCLNCEICKVKVTSAKIFQRHLDGRKHKLRAERQGKEFKCELCDIVANSEIQLDIHLKSVRHKTKLQRKNYPHLASFNFLFSKISLLIFVTFICILLNLYLLYRSLYS